MMVEELIRRARDAGLEVWRDGDLLRVRGPTTAAAIGREVLARKAEVLARLDPPPAPEEHAADCAAPAVGEDPLPTPSEPSRWPAAEVWDPSAEVGDAFEPPCDTLLGRAAAAVLG